MISISSIIFVISSFVELEKRFIYSNLLTLSLSFLSVISLSILIKTIKNKNQPTNVLEFLSLLIAMVFWFAGEASYSYLQIVEGEVLPFPGPPEIFFFSGYFFLIYYLYPNFKFWSQNKTIKKSYVIFSFSLTVFLISIILYITIQEEINEIDVFLTVSFLLYTRWNYFISRYFNFIKCIKANSYKYPPNIDISFYSFSSIWRFRLSIFSNNY